MYRTSFLNLFVKARNLHNTQNSYKSSNDLFCRRFYYKTATHCIFDVDGTLIKCLDYLKSLPLYCCKIYIDSEIIYKDIVAQLVAKYGKRKLPDDVGFSITGETKHKLCETIIKEMKMNVSLSVLMHQFTEMAKSRVPQAPLHKGVDRLVSHLYNNKVPMAIATNSTRATLNKIAKEKPDFFKKFHHMVTLDDVKKGKPEPDVYLTAASLFKEPAEPESCLVFEDSTTGLRAALAANMQVVLTPHKNEIDEEYIEKPLTKILPNLLHFNPEDYGLPPFKLPPPKPLDNSPLRTIENDYPTTTRFTKP